MRSVDPADAPVELAVSAVAFLHVTLVRAFPVRREILHALHEIEEPLREFHRSGRSYGMTCFLDRSQRRLLARVHLEQHGIVLRGWTRLAGAVTNKDERTRGSRRAQSRSRIGET